MSPGRKSGSSSRTGRSTAGARPPSVAASEGTYSEYLRQPLPLRNQRGPPAPREAVGAQCPPWSTPFKAAVRRQSSTLQFKVDPLPDGLVEAQGRLEQRRYQPTSADHGLAYRLREWRPAPAASAASAPATPLAPKPAPAPPSWWGQAGGVEESRPCYEDHGSWYPRQSDTLAGREMLRSGSLPLLNGKYAHENPFTAQWMKRGPGGLIVCDISVCPKP
mmetsp:Transcript_46709/g.134543  ORF Transcript_46709/g.134543 Transcript_46709/m.134543 type:complete len:219 (-) Transcript_46709:165-821(-)